MKHLALFESFNPTVAKGQTYIFTPTGMEITISNVTDKNVSWPVDRHKSGSGKNELKFATIRLKRFLEAIEDETYKLKE